MASFNLTTHVITRKKGSQVPHAAAYRAGERIRNERTGAIRDFSHRDDVLHKEIILPPDLAGRPEMARYMDRTVLWNLVEERESQWNSRLAREWIIRLPEELTPRQRCALAVRFGEALASGYHCVVDVCVHLPRPTQGEDCHHAHILMTRREVTLDGFGERIQLEWSYQERRKAGLEGETKGEIKGWRVHAAMLINDALERAGFGIRVTHRSLREQGFNIEPEAAIPKRVFYAERNTGRPHPVGEALRAEQRERAAARKQGPEEYERVVARQKAQRRLATVAGRQKRAQERPKIPWGALTKEQRREVERARRQARLERETPEQKARRRARQNEAARRWREAHPEKVIAAARAWQKRNPEVRRQAARRYREVHGAEISLRRREKYRSNPEAAREAERTRVARRRILKYARGREYDESQAGGPARSGPGEDAGRQRSRKRRKSKALDLGFDIEL